MNTTKILLASFIVLILASSCQNNKKTTVADNTDYVKSRELAALWYRYSAEKEAIYYQTYRLAKIALDENHKKHKTLKTGKKAAVVLDIDETVLDNVPQQLKLLQLKQAYTKESWVEWVKQVKAKPLAGSLDFTQYAQNSGVEVFYVSNRYTENIKYSIENLKKYNYPNADTAHVLLREESGDKTKRRELISKKYDIILLLGDNLCDFSEDFGKRDKSDMGMSVVEKNKNLFGTKYIVFPNPTYGEWEKAIYNNSFKWTEEQKDSLKQLLITPKY